MKDLAQWSGASLGPGFTVRSRMPRTWLVSSVPVVAEVRRVSQVPWNRQGAEEAGEQAAAALAVHLVLRASDPLLHGKSRAEAAHVITVDQAEDIMAERAPTLRLLDLALSGKGEDMVFGGPPCRTFSALRNVPVMNLGEGPRGPCGIVQEMEDGVVMASPSGRRGGFGRMHDHDLSG